MNWKHAFIGCTVLLAIVASDVGIYYWGHNKGALEGIKAYHQQCYEIGGFVVDDQGKVVACQGQGTIPQENLKHFKSTI